MLLDLIDKGLISNSSGKKIFKEMFEHGGNPEDIANKNGWIQIDDIDFIKKVIREVLVQNPQSVKDYKNGKDKAFGYLVGQSMKAFKGRGNPQLINKTLKILLEE